MPYTKPSELYQGPIDFNAGFICFTVFWRPTEDAPTPNFPGEKLSMTIFIPVAPHRLCLCGSGKTFGACCQHRRFWELICPNPGLPEEVGYSKRRGRSATFTNVDNQAVHARLMEDSRLRCTEDAPESGFWIYDGDPAIETAYGIMCFGDIELKPDHTLYVTALSHLRMQALLKILQEDCGDLLSPPELEFDPVKVFDKRTKKWITRRVSSRRRAKW